ncbi:killer toxin resistant protein [Mucor velutinosus]|uniref:Killer toxin resistant protein n=1 Tax=Mucor velutinosus TaxID=708070 RepID=A0AAN7HQ48_9FUNG|nr:killer toxin resistant protein [Mucor velutinosus]
MVNAFLSDIQCLFTDASSANNMFNRPTMNANTSISQVTGEIGAPREFSGFPVSNIFGTPETYELQSEVFGAYKESIETKVPDNHTLIILSRVQEITIQPRV